MALHHSKHAIVFYDFLTKVKGTVTAFKSPSKVHIGNVARMSVSGYRG